MKKIVTLSLLVLIAGLNNPSTANAMYTGYAGFFDDEDKEMKCCLDTLKTAAKTVAVGTGKWIIGTDINLPVVNLFSPVGHVRNALAHTYAMYAMGKKGVRDLTCNEKKEALNDFCRMFKEGVLGLVMIVTILYGLPKGAALLAGYYGVSHVSALAWLTRYCACLETSTKVVGTWGIQSWPVQGVIQSRLIQSVTQPAAGFLTAAKTGIARLLGRNVAPVDNNDGTLEAPTQDAQDATQTLTPTGATGAAGWWDTYRLLSWLRY